jgi:glycosyltransferase involved in cell wall biosynthesis
MTKHLPWKILTGEFPPGGGGVGDYTAQLAASLAAAGDEVTVFRPPVDGASITVPGVQVVTLPDHYGAVARSAIARRLDHKRARVLVQYVPQAYGMRGANVAFCRWLHRRFLRGDDIRVMFHEPYFYLSLHPGHAALAAFQRAMAAILLRSARHVYLSTASWLPYLRPYAPRGFDPITLPIPSTIPAIDNPGEVAAVRTRVSGRASRLIGHFGTYGDHIAPLLGDALVALLQDASIAALCIGERGETFVHGLVQRAPALAERLHATGRLSAEEVSIHLQSCDVILQPYPDGVTTRRTSMMAALVNGRPVVTTSGDLTESVWKESNAAVLVEAGDAGALADAVRRLLGNDATRASLAMRARTAYAEHFAIARSIATLRDGRGARS